MIGQTISHYQITEQLGRGGMGVVYKAKDTKLDRTVALKFLPPHSLPTDDDKARFYREAKAAAKLSHANIAHIYEIDETDDGQAFIAMEYVEGETLREIITRGPLPLDDAFDYAIQVAEGLAAAHKQGIVHRDVKPENVILSEEGHLKILDFGLAKLQGASLLTKEGTTLGTMAYMSPEQLLGEAVDARTDIWSLGVVLYEMVTGQLPFQGDYDQALSYGITNLDPESTTSLRAGVPLALDGVIGKCLAKEQERRYQHVAEVPVDLKAIDLKATGLSRISTTTVTPAAGQEQTLVQRVLSWRLAGITGIVIALVAGFIGWMLNRTQPTNDASQYLHISLPEDVPVVPTGFALTNRQPSLALSLDGSLLVYVSEHDGTTQLYKRSMDRFEPPQPIPGTEQAYNPFFSPDGTWIGFFTNNMLKKVSLQGGAPETLCAVTQPYGAAWTPDDRIFFVDSEGDQLSWVTASGGTPQILTGDITGGYAFLWPSLLPDNQHLLVMNNIFAAYAVSLETGQQKLLMEDAKYPRYIPTGHLTFVRRGKLMAVPFNLTRLEVTGPPVSILDNVRTESLRGAAQYAFSAKGTLAYLEGHDADEGRFVWVDRQGVVVDTLPLPPDNYGIARLSPDGQRLAYGYNRAQSNIWIYDLVRGGTSSELFTTEGRNYGPRWTPDRTKIAFDSDRRQGISDVYWKAVTGGEAELLVSSNYFKAVGPWTPDGRVFLYAEVRPSTGWDILTFSMEEETSQPFVATPASESMFEFSPDGNYVAYTSNKSGQLEIYVKSYPPTDQEWRISTDGGADPHWSPDGNELYYRDLTQRKMMVVSIEKVPAFDPGLPQVLFEGNYLDIPGPSYDVSRDGTRFLMLKGTDDKTAWTQVNVVTNWFEELKRRVPTDK